MLTRLKFKNWRSLRDVEIKDLTPVTVFIGANSSGKSNILDALHFYRYAENAGDTEAAFVWKVREKVRTIGVSADSSVALELTCMFGKKDTAIAPVTQTYTLSFLGDTTFYHASGAWPEPNSSFAALRWQLLREGFSPASTVPADEDPGPDGLYIVAPFAQNVSHILNFMQQIHPNIYQELDADLQQLLGYISQLGAVRDDKESRFFVEERSLLGHEAPTISFGTRRLIAMLTAYYALDMRTSELPGLVAIEEPDMAVHPLLLRRLVELMRNYVEGDKPRQFILTTHNPMFLNLFEPEEVRIVERNEQGETTVNEVPEHIKDIWLKDGEYGLGDVWTTRSLGGVPE